MVVTLTGCNDPEPQSVKSVDLQIESTPICDAVPLTLQTSQSEVTVPLTKALFQLSDGRYYQSLSISAEESEALLVRATSSSMEPMLMLGSCEGGIFQVASRGTPDGRGQSVTLPPASGEMRLVATTSFPLVTGELEVSLEAVQLTADEGSDQTVTPSRNEATAIHGPAPIALPKKALRLAPSKRALLIGISDYVGDDYDLPGVPNDLTRMKSALLEHGFEEDDFKTLTNEQATREAIIDGVNNHLAQVDTAGVAVLLFSGHGIQLDANAGIVGSGDVELDGTDEALVVAGPADTATLLLDDELGALVSNIPTDRVMVVVDACHAGTGTRGQSGLVVKELSQVATRDWFTVPSDFSETLANRPSSAEIPYLFLAASAERQAAFVELEGRDGPGSVFTLYLTKNLREADPNMSFRELMDKVEAQASGYVWHTYRQEQNPQLEGGFGDISIREFFAR